MRKVVFYTYAYHAEDTLRRTADSVLSQTYDNWLWYVIDNGSTNRKTSNIIHKYAKRDSRVIALANKQNHIWDTGNAWWEIMFKHEGDDFFCILDADDEYKPDFAEKMLKFAEDHALEVVASGNDFINAVSGKVAGVRCLKTNLIITGDKFSEDFVRYHQFMRTMWGKLYKFSVLQKYDFSKASGLHYGGDTLFATENFRNANRVGILSESLHKYYLAAQSASYLWEPKRIESDHILHETARAFLLDKCGFISPRNEEFLLVVYMNAIKDSLNVLFQSKASYNEILTSIFDVFLHQYTKHLAARENFGAHFGGLNELQKQRRDLFGSIADFLLKLQEVPDEMLEQFCSVGEIVCAVAENSVGWLFFKKLRVRFLLENGQEDGAKKGLEELTALLPEDEEVKILQMILYSDSERI